VLCAVTVIVIMLYVFFKIKYRARNSAFAKFPTPRKRFLLHNSLEMVGLDFVGFFKTFEKFHRELGDVFLLTIHPFDCGTIFINDPVIAEVVSFHQPDRSRSIGYKALGRLIGSDGYFLTSGDKLKSRSKPIKHVVHSRFYEKVSSCE